MEQSVFYANLASKEGFDQGVVWVILGIIAFIVITVINSKTH